MMRAAAAVTAAILFSIVLGERAQSAPLGKIVGKFEIVIERDRFTDRMETFTRTTGANRRTMTIRCGDAGLEIHLSGGAVFGVPGDRYETLIRIDRGEVVARPARVNDAGALRIWLGALEGEMSKGREIAFRFQNDLSDWAFDLAGAEQVLPVVASSCGAR